MKKLHPTSQFKRDFKKYKHNPSKVAAFEKDTENAYKRDSYPFIA